MAQRRFSEAVIGSVLRVAANTGNTTESVAAATGIDLSKRQDMTFSEMVAVGGFLHVRPEQFVEGVAR